MFRDGVSGTQKMQEWKQVGKVNIFIDVIFDTAVECTGVQYNCHPSPTEEP